MISELIEHYEAGPRLLSQAVAGMSEDQLNARPIAGKWSTRQVVCHLADFEPIYADRMKRILAEQEPMILGADPDDFLKALAYDQRDVKNELVLIESVRKQMASLLRTLNPDDFERVGHHNHDGALTLKTLLERITRHIPHHVAMIEEKKRALGL